MIGPYRPHSLLGRGGMGSVWLAEHERLGFEVALKTLPGVAQHRFDSEVAALAGLHHPHIVQIHDCGRLEQDWSGQEAGTPWLAMERCDATLAERPPEDSTHLRRVLLQILDALGESHGHGILHLDIKPSNLLWRGSDVVVADFGLASRTGDLPGDWLTPGLCAPEHRAGDRDRLGPWSDLYALALTLERLTVDPGDLRAWIDRATADRLQDRFPSAAAARRELIGTARPRSGPLPIAPTRRSDSQPETLSPPPAPEPVEVLPNLELHQPSPLHRGAGLGLWGRGAPPLIGRSRELTHLWSRLARTPSRFSVYGPPGIGKTRLADAVLAAAHRLGGFTRVRLELVPTEAPDLRAAARQVPGSAFGTGLAGSWIRDQLPPSLEVRGFLSWLESVQPAVLHVDGATHLTDELAAGLEQLRGGVFVLYTSREEVPADESLLLEPLSDTDARHLLVGVLGLDSPTALRLGLNAAGNPAVALFAVETALNNRSLERGRAGLRLVGEPVHPHVDRMWEDRIEGAPDPVRRALEAVAVLGHAFSSDAIEPTPLRWAVQQGLLDVKSETLQWTHPSARQAVLAGAPSLPDLHRTAAATTEHPAHRGLHLLAAGEPAEAAQSLWEGFWRAMKQQNLYLAQRCDTALERLERPLDRLRHHVARAGLQWAQNHDAEAWKALELAGPLLEHGGEWERAEFLLTKAHLLTNRFDLQGAIACYHEIDTAAVEHGALYVAHGLARCLGWSGREEEALDVLEGVLHVSDARRRDDLLLVKATTLHTLQRLEEATAIYRDLIKSRPILAYQAASNLADLQRQQGELKAARESYREAYRLAEAAGAELSFAKVCAPMTEAITDPEGTYRQLQLAIRSASSVPVQGFGEFGCLHCCPTREAWNQHWTTAFTLVPELPSDPDVAWFLKGARDHAQRRGWHEEAALAAEQLARIS